MLDLQSANSVRLTVEIAQGLGQVEGVALREGKGTGGAMILLVSNELLSRGVRGSSCVVGRDQSDSDGTFAIRAVPPGEYTVVAVQNGWDQAWADLSVLQTWLTGGTKVIVVPNDTRNVKVSIQ